MTLSLGIVTGSISRNAGGLFNSVRKSAIHLAEAGANVSVYALEDEYSANDFAAWAPLSPSVLRVRHRAVLPFAPDLGLQLAAADHNVLHLHGIWQLQSRSVNHWKRSFGLPVMISPRGMLDPWALSNSGWKKRLAGVWYENRNLREADCLHALNASEASSMRAYGLTNSIAIIPNATDLPIIEPRRYRGGRKTILFLGRLHPKKGLSELIKAWAIACGQQNKLKSEWQLWVAGWDDGGQLAALQHQIDDLNLRGSVSIIGPAFGDEKDRLLRQVDAFILPSHSEGLPMSVLEAWAYRLPVLMTAHCNLPEGFAAGAALEITNDPDRLAGSLQAALLDGDLLPVGEAGRQLVERQFNWNDVAGKHLAVYEWLCRGGERPACVVPEGV
jgi:glycosyltransferase involved in cell wall biosynthesis